MIRKAGKCLKDVFEENGLFRIGGDEMFVLCPNTGEEFFQESVEELRNRAKECDVAIAIGYVWKEKASENIDRLMTDAERWMYSDKTAYYKQIGMERRR